MKYYEIYFKFTYNKRMRKCLATFDKEKADATTEKLQALGAETKVKVTDCN